MTSSPTDIGNLALDLLSAGTVTNIETPSNPTEDLLNRWYDTCRKKVLREHPWNFAAKRAVISASSTTPAWKYSKAFPIPNDFIRFLSIQDSEGFDIDNQSYEVEFVGSQRCILYSTESSSLRIRYVFDVEDVTQFDPMFVEMLSYEIALAIAYKVTESNGTVERVGTILDRKTKLAKAIDGQERPPTIVQRSRSIKARRNFPNDRYDRITWE